MAGGALAQPRTWVKVCGLTRADDVLAAATAGVDAIGFVFATSPREVSLSRAETLAQTAREVRDDLLCVGIFVDPTPDEVAEAVKKAGLGGVQIYGGDYKSLRAALGGIALFCVGRRVTDGSDPIEFWQDAGVPHDADTLPDALLVDASKPGSGKSFDWGLLEEYEPPPPLILAGGLSPDNVGRAIERVRPWGVDVSTGVESQPGLKDPEKIRDFVRAVWRADAARVRAAR